MENSPERKIPASKAASTAFSEPFSVKVSSVLLPELLDALTAEEASRLRSSSGSLAQQLGVRRLWRNVRIRMIARLQKCQSLAGRPLELRRLEISSEMLPELSLDLFAASLEELRVEDLLVAEKSIDYRKFCNLLSMLPELRVLELPKLICLPGGAHDLARHLSRTLRQLRRLRLPQTVLLECRALNWAAEACEARVNCWKIMAAELSKLPLTELDLTGALRPIAPEQLRPWPPPRVNASVRLPSLCGFAVPLQGPPVDGDEEVLPCSEDLLGIFQEWSYAMSEINKSFKPGVVLHEDWDEEIRRAKERLRIA